MADQLRISVVTPERTFYTGEASMVELATTEGRIGVYRDHIPLTAVTVPGVLRIHEESGIREAALMTGLLEVLPEKITILADAAEWPEEIDEERASNARARAEERIGQPREGIDTIRAEVSLKKALVRLSLVK